MAPVQLELQVNRSMSPSSDEQILEQTKVETPMSQKIYEEAQEVCSEASSGASTWAQISRDIDAKRAETPTSLQTEEETEEVCSEPSTWAQTEAGIDTTGAEIPIPLQIEEGEDEEGEDEGGEDEGGEDEGGDEDEDEEKAQEGCSEPSTWAQIEAAVIDARRNAYIFRYSECFFNRLGYKYIGVSSPGTHGLETPLIHQHQSYLAAKLKRYRIAQENGYLWDDAEGHESDRSYIDTWQNVEAVCKQLGLSYGSTEWAIVQYRPDPDNGNACFELGHLKSEGDFQRLADIYCSDFFEVLKTWRYSAMRAEHILMLRAYIRELIMEEFDTNDALHWPKLWAPLPALQALSKKLQSEETSEKDVVQDLTRQLKEEMKIGGSHASHAKHDHRSQMMQLPCQKQAQDLEGKEKGETEREGGNDVKFEDVDLGQEAIKDEWEMVDHRL